MKKDFMKAMFLMLCAVFAFTFTACSDDDDPVDDAATQVAGSYSGNLEVFMGGQSLTTAQKTISLTRKSATTVDLTINNFTLEITGLGSVNLGNVTIQNCTLTENGNGYAIGGTITLEGVDVPITEQMTLSANCTVTLNGATVDGTTFNMPLTIEVVVPDMGEEPLDLGITATFTGTK